MKAHHALTTRGGRRPIYAFAPSRPVLARTAKDQDQDKKIQVLKKTVKKIQYAEPLNWKDVYVNGVTSSTPTVTNLLPTAHGDSTGTYEGDAINVTSVQFRARLLTDSDNLGPVEVRLLIVWDKNSNEAAPNMMGSTGVLDDGVITDDITAPINQHNRERFKVLYDKTFVLNPMTRSDTAFDLTQVMKRIQFYKKTNRLVKFGTTGNPPITNGLYAMWVANVTTDAPFIVFGSRVYYHP